MKPKSMRERKSRDSTPSIFVLGDQPTTAEMKEKNQQATLASWYKALDSRYQLKCYTIRW